MTRFVADFVGAANLLKGEILEDRGGRLMVHVGDGIILATPSFPSAPPVGARVLLCIRPEAVRLDAQLDEGEEAVHLHGHVEQAVFEGARVVYTVRVSGELLLRVDVANPKGPTLKVGGQAVTLAIAPSVVTLMTGE
jgi:ABC-type Fe3+/spermidine/putrescine transport system ATPase subunit